MNAKCTICEREDADFTHYGMCEERQVMEERGVCFNCAFWIINQKKHAEYPNYFIADGNSYYIGDEHAKSEHGFGGARFRVTFPDGRVVETTNLWHQGTIPEWQRPERPDNAKLSGWMTGDRYA